METYSHAYQSSRGSKLWSVPMECLTSSLSGIRQLVCSKRYSSTILVEFCLQNVWYLQTALRHPSCNQQSRMWSWVLGAGGMSWMDDSAPQALTHSQHTLGSFGICIGLDWKKPCTNAGRGCESRTHTQARAGTAPLPWRCEIQWVTLLHAHYVSHSASIPESSFGLSLLHSTVGTDYSPLSNFISPKWGQVSVLVGEGFFYTAHSNLWLWRLI